MTPDDTTMSAATPLFSEDELMHVLSEIDTDARVVLASRPVRVSRGYCEGVSVGRGLTRGGTHLGS